MDHQGKDVSKHDDIDSIGFGYLSLGQKLLANCVKKTGISVSVRGIAVNTTSQTKTVGSAWKSEGRYDTGHQKTISTSLDDVSFPDLLGSSNRDLLGKKGSFLLSSKSQDSSFEYNLINDTKSIPINKCSSDIEHDIIGDQFLMPGMKGTYPLGFTNFIGKGIKHPPPPPPSSPYPTQKKSKNKIIILSNKSQVQDEDCKVSKYDNEIYINPDYNIFTDDRISSPIADLREVEGEVNRSTTHSGMSSHPIAESSSVSEGITLSSTRRPTRGLADSSPLEVTSLSSTRRGASSNYLSLKGMATPRDRGRSVDGIGGNEYMTSSGSGLPEADLREAEGEINREADGRTTSSGRRNQVEDISRSSSGTPSRRNSNIISGGSRLHDKLSSSRVDNRTYNGDDNIKLLESPIIKGKTSPTNIHNTSKTHSITLTNKQSSTERIGKFERSLTNTSTRSNENKMNTTSTPINQGRSTPINGGKSTPINQRSSSIVNDESSSNDILNTKGQSKCLDDVSNTRLINVKKNTPQLKNNKQYKKYDTNSGKNPKNKRSNASKSIHLDSNIDDDDNWRSTSKDLIQSPKNKPKNNLNFNKEANNNINEDRGNKNSFKNTRKLNKNN